MTADSGLILAVISVIGLPMLAFVVRATIKWTRVEDQLANLINDIDKLVRDMREDRRATNERLTWLERYLYGRSFTNRES